MEEIKVTVKLYTETIQNLVHREKGMEADNKRLSEMITNLENEKNKLLKIIPMLGSILNTQNNEISDLNQSINSNEKEIERQKKSLEVYRENYKEEEYIWKKQYEIIEGEKNVLDEKNKKKIDKANYKLKELTENWIPKTKSNMERLSKECEGLEKDLANKRNEFDEQKKEISKFISDNNPN